MSEPTAERPMAAGRLARVSLRTWLLAAGTAALAVTALVQGVRRTGRRAVAATPTISVAAPAPRPPPAPASSPLATPLPGFFENRLPSDSPSGPAETPPTPLDGGYRRDVVRPRPVVNVDRQEPAEETPASPDEAEDRDSLAGLRRTARTVLPEIFRMPRDNPPGLNPPIVTAASNPPKASRPDKDPTPPLDAEPASGFAPFGRLVKCTLVNTLDSLTARSEPIVAIVSDTLAWGGQTILPAGTEVFGYARPDPLIDARGVGRLTDTGEWTLVLPAETGGADGRELILRGRAVDRSELAPAQEGRPRAWGPDDGADGLIGYTIATLDDADLRLFSAVAVSGLASGAADLAERRESVPGLSGALGATEPAETAGNLGAAAAGQGATAIANEFAARIRQEIAKHGVYVRVPAGTTFYLFVEQTIDLRLAAVGLRLPAGERVSEDRARSSPPSP